MSAVDLAVDLDDQLIVVVPTATSRVVVEDDESITVEIVDLGWEITTQDKPIEIVTVGVQGPMGPPGGPGVPGPQGEQGEPGLSTDALISHLHDQSVPSDTWVIFHPLPFLPNVTTIDTSGTEIVGSVTYENDGSVVVRFSSATAGRAFLS